MGGGGLGEGIGRLRHFKSPDDWVRDDGCAPFSYETELHLGSAPLCVFTKSDKSKNREKNKTKKTKSNLIKQR